MKHLTTFLLTCLLLVAGLAPTHSYAQSEPIKTLIFQEDFEQNQWPPEITPVQNILGSAGFVGIQSGYGLNGSFGVGMYRSSNGTEITQNGIDLALQLSNYSGQPIHLTFDIEDYFDETHFGDAIYLSNNGGASFERVLAFDPGEWCNNYGQLPPIPIHLLAEKAGLNLNDQFVIRICQAGFQASNLDGIYLDNIRVYVPDQAYFPVAMDTDFFEDFETGSLDKYWSWVYSDSTAIAAVKGPNFPDQLVRAALGEGYDGSAGLELSRRCSGSYGVGAAECRIDASAVADQPVMLSFWIYDYFDETHIDDAIWLSVDGGKHFHRIYNFQPQDWCNDWGQLPPLPLRELAAQHGLTLSDSTIIRFQHGGQQAANLAGIYLDDIRVYVAPDSFRQAPFIEDFEQGQWKPYFTQRLADGTAILTNGGPINRPSNRLAIDPGEGLNGSFGLTMSKRCSDGPSTIAWDLHANLAGFTQVRLKFDYRHYFDETEIDDAIWLSNDGGQTFVRIYNFDFDNIQSNQWQSDPVGLDLTALAAAKGISSLSDSVVVRFQWHGDESFNDGLDLDNIGFAVSGGTGLFAPTVPRLSVYPNPAQHQVRIALPQAGSHPRLQLLDLTGRILTDQLSYDRIGQDLRIDVRDLPTGYYLLVLDHDAGRHVGRFFKE